jgi:hypothetical protein
MAMFEGTLLAESLRTGSTLDQLDLTVRKIARYAPADTTDDQPAIWTAIDFEVADDGADALASALAAVLGEPGWYANFQSADVAFVIFQDKVFRYPRGDPDGRAAAQAHGRARGVPEPQLDWTV